MLSKRFKKIIAVENNKNSIERLESNIRKFCYKNIKLCKKKLVQIKNNLKDCITFKELIYYNVHKFFQNISLIVCEMNGEEEEILEDIFIYAFYSKVNILIKLNLDNWKNKDINRFKYIFDHFKFDKNLLLYNEWIYFEPHNDNNIQLFKNNMSIVIIGFNQYTYISKMVKQLEPYTNDIIIIDNNSDYKPLLDYYDNEYKYTLLRMDKNFGHKVYEESFIVNMLGNIYIITDPDLEFNKNLPKNFIQEMIQVCKDYKAGRVGFALLIDVDDIRSELSYAGMPIKKWEGRFWLNKINHPRLDLYSAAIDTTFCLLNTLNNENRLSIRIAGDYTCKHKPWHKNYYLELLDDEYDHYLLNNRSTNFWIDKSKKEYDKLKQINNTIEINNDETILNETIEINNNETILNDSEINKNIVLDDWIIDRVKNNKKLCLNISNESISLDNLVNNFKQIINITHNIKNLNSENELNYFNKIVTIKKNYNDITLKEFIYKNIINEEYIINFINLIYNGDEENILEDILHYCWISKSNVYIHFNINNWENKNISRFNYLFEFYDIFNDDNLIINVEEYLKNNLNGKLLFVIKCDFIKNLFKKNMSCVIIGFNQPTYIKKMVEQLEIYTNDIIIIDNNSDFKPLLDYYDKEYKYTLLKMNKNFGHKVYNKIFIDKLIGDIFILTDPDLEFNENLPINFIENMINISNYFEAEKVGFALEYKSANIRTDIKAFGKSIHDWEKQYWITSFYYPNHEIWSAAIDTTFCLINKQNKGGHYRIAGDYLCKHLPWYNNFDKNIPNDEFDYYIKNNISTNYWKK